MDEYEKSIESIIQYMYAQGIAPIVRHYDGYIVLAQNEKDFNSKVRNIQYGDTNGFYTVESLAYKQHKHMNTKITGNASVQCEFTVDVKLTLGEAEALKAMASYNTRDFLDALYEKLGKSYIQPHEEDLKSLFSTIKQTLPAEIKRLNEIKEKIEKALS